MGVKFYSLSNISCPFPFNVGRELHQESDVFVYCGHGAGEKVIQDSRYVMLKLKYRILYLTS